MFRRDIALGDDGESKVIKLLTSINCACSLNKERSKRSLYDILAQGPINFTVEVKNDNYSLKSGNIAIELYNVKSGKPSGLGATKADIWAVVRGQEVWVCKTADLRLFVENNKPCRIIECGGDDNAYLYLYDKDRILPVIFKRIDALNNTELQQIVDKLLC